MLYSIRAGTELKPGERWAVTSYVAWLDSFNGDVAGGLTYGVSVHHDPGQGFSGRVALEGDDRFNVKLSLGAVFRF